MRDFTLNSIIIILGILFIHQYEDKKALSETSKKNQLTLLDSVNYYKNALGQEVAEKRSFQGTVDELETIIEQKKAESKQLAEALKKWKFIANATEIKTVTEIKEVAIPFEVPIPCEFSRTFVKHDPFYSIGGEVNQNQIFIDNIFVPDTQTIVAGSNKLGWYKTEIRAEITHSNPNIKTLTIDNFTFVEQKKRFGIGASFGFGVYHNGFFVGPSFNYNLIEF